MAERQRPHDYIAELPDQHVLNYIRMIRKSKDTAELVENATKAKLEELEVPRNLSAAFTRMPNGSDQTDTLSLMEWMSKITKEDDDAIEQLICLDATAHTAFK